MAAFLPARQLWKWSGKGYKRPGGKGRGKKEFFKSIQRGKETINASSQFSWLCLISTKSIKFEKSTK